MATLTLSIASQSKSFTISAADITRTLNAMRTRYGQVIIQGSAPRDLTDAEVFDLWTKEVVKNLKDTVLEAEGNTARAVIVGIVAS